jgi:diguanylate cyclase (GGDEF)-like protein
MPDFSDRRFRCYANESAYNRLELAYQADLDPLTRIANRRYFDRYLGQVWQQLAWWEVPLSLILINLDFFQAYNEYYGYPVGDRCLVQVVQAVQSIPRRATDLVARYGGNQFATLLPATRPEGAIAVTEGILKAIRDLQIPHERSPTTDILTASIGVTTLVPGTDYFVPLLVTQAEKALAVAQRQGGDRYFCCA